MPLYLLVGLLSVKQTVQSHVTPQEPPLLAGKPSVPALIRDQTVPTPARVVMTASMTGEFARVDSDFYLTRTSGFDRTLSVSLAVVSPSAGLSRQVTTFVTFLPGQKEQLVAIGPIIENFFAPGQEVFVRIVPGPKYSNAKG